jgi:hypothetical protein
VPSAVLQRPVNELGYCLTSKSIAHMRNPVQSVDEKPRHQYASTNEMNARLSQTTKKKVLTMLWKRSVIKDYYYKFPDTMMNLNLQKEDITVDASYGRYLQQAFDSMMALDFEEAITGQELIYTLDDQNNLTAFFTTKAWEGPVIEPEGEIEWEVPQPVDELLEQAAEINPEALYPTDMKKAVIGIVERCGMQPLVLLDRDKCIDILMEQGMDEDDAEEFFEVNTLGSWMGEGTPCFATLCGDLL